MIWNLKYPFSECGFSLIECRQYSNPSGSEILYYGEIYHKDKLITTDWINQEQYNNIRIIEI